MSHGMHVQRCKVPSCSVVLQQVRWWCAVSCPVSVLTPIMYGVHVPSSECNSTAQWHVSQAASLFGIQLRWHQLVYSSSSEFNRAPTAACVPSSRYRAETALAKMGGVKPAVSCQCQTTSYHWAFWYCFYNFPNVLFFFFSGHLALVLALYWVFYFIYCFPH